MKPYQVQDQDLTEAQRTHLQDNLFPLLLSLKKTAMKRLGERQACLVSSEKTRRL